MILDLPKFLQQERPYWQELQETLKTIDRDPYRQLNVAETTRLQYLYQRAASGLARLSTFSADPATREYLESLVARAYAECHPNRAGGSRFRPLEWLLKTFPRTFRRHARAFQLAVGLTVAGAAIGWGAMWWDADAKAVLMPFSQLMETPAERVHREENSKGGHLMGVKGTFSAELMTHNIEVAVFTLALGVTWGVGSTMLLFSNGVALGAVAADYIHSGFTPFLLGWLLPHGVIEIPAILVAGQASFVLASALIGWGDGSSRRKRLRLVSEDVLTLIGGAAAMLIWAGIVEAFISQYHYPVLPYGVKIAFGSAELAGLVVFLSRSGRAGEVHASR